MVVHFAHSNKDDEVLSEQDWSAMEWVTLVSLAGCQSLLAGVVAAQARFNRGIQ